MTDRIFRSVSQAATAPGAIPLGMLPTHHMRRDAGRAWLTTPVRTVNRAEFEARANRRARLLQTLGVRAGDFVTIALPNGLEFYETTFAIWKLGAVPNPVSAKLTPIEFDAIVELVQPRLIVGDVASAGSIPVLRAGARLDGGLSPEALPEIVSPYWKAMTSGGSTGRPKVIIDHMSGRWSPDTGAYGQVADDTLLNGGPLYHNAPFGMMHLGLFTGAHVIDMERFDAETMLSLIAKHRVGWINLVPTMMHRIWRLPPERRLIHDLSSLQVVFHMAAACPAWLKTAWIEWLGPARIWELYGGTEGQGGTLINGLEWLDHKGSVGRRVSAEQLRVLDEAGNDCAPGKVGEIFLRPPSGRGSTYHYLGAEACAVGEWESLGDLGYLDTDDYLYLVDRRVDLIISGGVNIYPAEVEAAIEAHPDVEASVVLGLPDGDLGQSAHAVVQRRAVISADELTTFLSSRLVKYKIPRSFEFTDAPLRDEAGKVRRGEMRAERQR